MATREELEEDMARLVARITKVRHEITVCLDDLLCDGLQQELTELYAARKELIRQLTAGDTVTSVDLDEFLSKKKD